MRTAAAFAISLSLLPQQAAAAFLTQQAPPPSFVKDVAPIFAANCTNCHGAGVKMGTFELDTHENILKGGAKGAVVVAGKPEESRLFLMITGKAQPAMPMGGKALAAGEVDVIRRWIEAGAKGPAPGESAPVPSAAKIPEIKPKGSVKPQIYSLAYRPTGGMVAVGGWKEVRLADSQGKTLATLPGHSDAVRTVAFSNDGKWLAAAGGLPGRRGQVKIWSVDAKENTRTFEGHTDCIYAVAISPDGKWIATSSYDKLIKLWDAGTGAEVRTLKDHIDAVYALEFTPDGKRLVSGGADRTVKIWDVASGERLYTFGQPTDGINTIALSPDGTKVAAGGLDKTVRVWSMGEKDGELLHSLIAHEDAILKLAWSPDGAHLVSSGADRTIKILRADDLTEVRALPNQPDWAYAIDFAPDGRSFAAGRHDGSFTVYEMQPQSRAALR